MSFTEHIGSAVQSGKQMAGWALRTFRRRERYLMLTVLKTLSQPRLDYCRQLWSPTDQSSINKVENIQRNFISHIKDPQMTGLNYWEKLSHFNGYSQERRRERFDIFFCGSLARVLLKDIILIGHIVKEEGGWQYLRPSSKIFWQK